MQVPRPWPDVELPTQGVQAEDVPGNKPVNPVEKVFGAQAPPHVFES